MPSRFKRPNLSLVSVSCVRRCRRSGESRGSSEGSGESLHAAKLDFPWNALFFAAPGARRPVLIGGDYGLFIFLLGVGTQPVGTLPL